MSIGSFRESLSQRILARTILVGRLGVNPHFELWTLRPPPFPTAPEVAADIEPQISRQILFRFSHISFHIFQMNSNCGESAALLRRRRFSRPDIWKLSVPHGPCRWARTSSRSSTRRSPSTRASSRPSTSPTRPISALRVSILQKMINGVLRLKLP